jgi:hypothetical protein
MAKKKAGPKPAGGAFTAGREAMTAARRMPSGPGGPGTTDTTVQVRRSAKRDAKARKAATKGAKVYDVRTGKRVAVGKAINPKTGDFHAGLRIEKGGNRMTTVGSEYH